MAQSPGAQRSGGRLVREGGLSGPSGGVACLPDVPEGDSSRSGAVVEVKSVSGSAGHNAKFCGHSIPPASDAAGLRDWSNRASSPTEGNSPSMEDEVGTPVVERRRRRPQVQRSPRRCLGVRRDGVVAAAGFGPGGRRGPPRARCSRAGVSVTPVAGLGRERGRPRARRGGLGGTGGRMGGSMSIPRSASLG